MSRRRSGNLSGFVITGAGDGGQPCVPRDFGRGSVVCVCNATYCDDIPRPDPRLLAAGRALLYVSSKAGLRFHAVQVNFTDELPDDTGKYTRDTRGARMRS